jgi:hypothetical protein
MHGSSNPDQMTILVPTEEDWGDYRSDLDRKYAQDLFAGHTNEEMRPYFRQNPIERVVENSIPVSCSSKGVVLTKFAQSLLLPAIFSFAIASSAQTPAQTLTGTVTNATTSKPAAGDEVILINLTNGMDVAGSTKADAAGKFSFKLSGPPGPHLIRAVHQGVTYHQMAPPGTGSVDINVYDVATKVTGLSVTVDVLRFQTDNGTLQGVRTFAVNNNSSPPKTQMNDHNFEFYLPANAKIEQVEARAPNGQPIAAQASPQADKNRYAIQFPLRPGETQFQLAFTVPYSGKITIDPKPLYPAEHFVIVLPKTMQFAAANPSGFEVVRDPSQGDNVMEVARQAKPGQQLGFTLQGNGTIVEPPEEGAAGGQQEPQPAASPTARDNRPGGGLGAPIDAPDALQKYRWPILFGFAVLLAVGGWVVTKRGPIAPNAPSATNATGTARPPLAAPPASTSAAQSASSSRSSILLEALKEEIFQLEVERRQGKITQEEYEKAKSALDQTLDRALKRQG